MNGAWAAYLVAWALALTLSAQGAPAEVTTLAEPPVLQEHDRWKIESRSAARVGPAQPTLLPATPTPTPTAEPEPEPTPVPEPTCPPGMEGDPTSDEGCWEPEPEPPPEPEYRHYDVGAVKPHVQAAANEIGTLFGVETIGGLASRSGPSEHPLGLALDFMVGQETGDAIAAYLLEHHERLHVSYVIWCQQINSLDGSGWRWMEDRGGTTANHYDHVHVSFLDV